MEIFLHPLGRRLTCFAGLTRGHWPSDVAIAAEDGKTARGVVAVELRRLGSSGTHDLIGN